MSSRTRRQAASADGPCALLRTASKRVSGGNPLDNARLRDFLTRLRRNTRDFDADGRVLRLKRFVPADCRPPVIDAVLDALAANTRVEVLYIQNFERGFGDEQLMHLLQVLKLGRIWAVNVGENFKTTVPAWREFAAGLRHTNVQYMYASEHHFMRTDLKTRMRDAIRVNRKAQTKAHDPEVVRCVGNMWFNPKNPTHKPGTPSPPRLPRLERARALKSRTKAARRLVQDQGSSSLVMRRPGGKRRIRLTEKAGASEQHFMGKDASVGGKRKAVTDTQTRKRRRH